MTERFVIWASLDAATGREAVNANQLLPTVDTKIAIRWSLASAAITAKWQAQEVDRAGVRFGPVFDIQSANDATRRREQIDILARSGALAS